MGAEHRSRYLITQELFFKLGAQAADEETRTSPEPGLPAPGDGSGSRNVRGEAYRALFQQHPEGGGPYGGRDNALTAMVGYLRRKRLDYHAGLWIAQSWNCEFCFPPLGEDEVHDKMGVKWHQWQEPQEADATPEDFQPQKETKPERVVLMADDLLDLEEGGHGQEWLIQDVFIEQGIHFLSAPAAGAKSWIALYLSQCVAGGAEWFGREVKQGSVLYVDEEMGQQKTGHRVKKLGFGRGLPFYYLGKQGVKINDRADLRYICELCRAHEVKLVVLDTLTGVRPGLMENEASHVSQLREYFNAIVATGATLLVLHHDRKSGQGEGVEVAHYRMAGSRDLGAMADMVYSVDKKGQYYTLSVSKNRLLPDEDTLTVDFALEDNEDKSGVTLRVLSATEKSSITVKIVEERIIDALTASGARMNTNAVCDAVRSSKAAVVVALKQMTAKGIIICEAEGQNRFYSL